MKTYDDLLKEYEWKQIKNRLIFEKKVKLLRKKCKVHVWNKTVDVNEGSSYTCVICGIER